MSDPQPAPRPHITIALPSLQTIWMSVITGLLVWQVFSHSGFQPKPPAPPVFNAITNGRAYGAELAHTYADALEAAAKTIRGGGTLADAQTKLKADWTSSHEKTFATRFGQAVTTLVAEGKEPETPSQRDAFANLLEGIAKGAKEVK
jgi:hypothetical protein